MEIKATLNKPYTEKQRLNFIVSENHQKGYEIKKTESTIEALGLTAEEQAEKEKEAHKKELMAQLDTVDLKTIRALRAISAGTGTPDDQAKLNDLETEAEDLRRQIKELGV